jgi:hypothetical protein
MSHPGSGGTVPVPACVVCGRAGAVEVEPPRRTLARGTDPTDPAYSIIAVLPDIALCEEHAMTVRSGDVSIGWCDDERCRRFGEVGGPSPCGTPYNKLRR